MLIKKRGYFFILDAVLGLLILVIGVFLITSSYANVPQPSQVKILSNDLLNFLSSTKIKDLNNPYAGIGGELWKQGIITDGENSLLQQIGVFYAKKNLEAAEKFIEAISKDIVPSQFKYEVWMNNEILYPKTLSAEQLEVHTKSRSNTEILLTSKKITFGINESVDIWGPYKAEVFVWER